MTSLYFNAPGARKKEVCEVADTYFTLYTLIKVTGSYNGIKTPSWILELVNPNKEALASFCNMVKWKYNQNTVLIVDISSTHIFM